MSCLAEGGLVTGETRRVPVVSEENKSIFLRHHQQHRKLTRWPHTHTQSKSIFHDFLHIINDVGNGLVGPGHGIGDVGKALLAIRMRLEVVVEISEQIIPDDKDERE